MDGTPVECRDLLRERADGRRVLLRNPRRNARLQFFEPVLHDDDLRPRCLFASGRRSLHVEQESPIRRNVVRERLQSFGIFRTGVGFSAMKVEPGSTRTDMSTPGTEMDPFTSHDKEQLAPIARPSRLGPPASRDRPESLIDRRERPHVHFSAPRLVRFIRQPSAVGRNRRGATPRTWC